MVRGRRDRRAVAAASVACAVVLGALLAAGGSAGADDAPSTPPYLTPELRTALEEAAARQEQEAEERQSPAAEEAREETRTAFEAQSAAEALATAGDEHPDVVSESAWRPFTSAEAADVERYYQDDLQARVDVPGEAADAFVQSTLPLRGETESGGEAPADLSLTEEGDDLEPKTPLVETTIPDELDEEVSLDESGIGFAPVGAGAASDAQLEEDTAFYANAGTDTDFLVRPEATGAHAFWQLRSADSPESLALDFELPAGATLEPGGDFNGAQIVQGGEELGQVSEPVAWDAEGWPVDLSFDVTGDAMTIEIPHRDQDLAYPILVDPIVVESQPNLDAEHTGWDQVLVSPSGKITNASGNGYLWTTGATAPANAYQSMEHGGWAFDSPGPEAYIFSVALTGVIATQHKSLVHQGAHSSAGDEAGTTNHATYPTSPVHTANNLLMNIQHCLGSNMYCLGGNVPGNRFLETIWSTSSTAHTAPFQLRTAGATVWLYDETAPTVQFSDDTPEWVDDELAVVTEGRDRGLGVKAFGLKLDNGTERVRTHDCVGDRFDRCPNDDAYHPSDAPEVSGDSFIYDTSSLPEGEHTLTAKVKDLADNWSGAEQRSVVVDHTAPELAATGNLTQHEAGAGQHSLHVEADDAIESIEVSIDGEPVAETDPASCTPEDESCSLDYALDSRDYASNWLHFEVTATDALGRTDSEEWDTQVQRQEAPLITLADESQGYDPSGQVSFVNEGGTNAHISDIQIVGDDADHFSISGPDGCTGTWLETAAANSCQITMSHDSGEYVADVQFTLDGEDTQYAPIYGQVPPEGPDIGLQDPNQAYDPSGAVSFVNEGDRGTEVADVEIVGDDASHFSITGGNTCIGATLAAEVGTCSIEMAHDSGDYYAEVAFTLDDEDESRRVGIYSAHSPDTTITVAPEATETPDTTTEETAATFEFVSSDSPATFECRWDTGTWEPCTSPATRTQLLDGGHGFQVRAIDGNGYVDHTPAGASWIIDTPDNSPNCAEPDEEETSVALEALETNSPEVVAPSEAASFEGETIDPALDVQSDTPDLLPSRESLAASVVPCEPESGMTIETTWGPLTLTPQETEAGASVADTVGGDAAVFANTAEDTDTVIRPTADGLANYTQMRSAEAPESRSWDVSMPGGIKLKMLDDGSVAIVADTAPQSGPPVQPDDATAPPIPDSEQGILADASLIPPGSGQDPSPPTAAASSGPPTPAPDAQANAAASANVEEQLDESAESFAAAGEELGPDEPLLAVLDSPWAVDSEGESVPVAISYDGTEVTMTVDHASEGFAYPIIADPDLKDCNHKPSPCGHYHEDHAEAYAQKNKTSRPPNYPHFDNDCANFVSQVLRAGGFYFMHDYGFGNGAWWAYRYDSTRKAWTDSFINSQRLSHHLREFDLASPVRHDEWRVGDVVFYEWDDDSTFDHSNVVAGVIKGGRKPLMLQHTKDYNHAKPLAKVIERANAQEGRKFRHLLHLRPRHTKANIPGEGA